MTVSWDKTDSRVWYGALANGQLRLIVEQLPNGNGYDWSVWRTDEPKIERRGTALTADEAAIAAAAAASELPHTT
jgi:hypothetical protein